MNKKKSSKTAIIIGAGPAGLTAAYELLKTTDIRPIILEATGTIGGISQTVNYKGNRMDIGGHRFFSKSDIVMEYWRDILPTQSAPSMDDRILGIEKNLETDGNADPEKTDAVLLLRDRLSRILYLRKFYDYPISLSMQTISNLGIIKMAKIGFWYGVARVMPIRPERSLEDFFINRFGRELYKTFFKDYTEKVWGVRCTEIKPEWGAQRIKGLSISKAIWHAVKSLRRKGTSADISQKDVETSLIDRFLYPKYGPGQMWEELAKKVVERGGVIHRKKKVTRINFSNNKIISVFAGKEEFSADYCFSTMPVKDLVAAMGKNVPENVQSVAADLRYRDFITVGMLLKKLKISNTTHRKTIHNIIPDNWIYIQESDVKVGRLQVFNNWSPYLVADSSRVWIGLEYFCNEGDGLWTMKDADFLEFAKNEMEKIGVIDKNDFMDGVVIRVPKTYPAYFGSYERFSEIREYVDKMENLFLVGRNGMHRYNNMDHSMLAAMDAVKCIKDGIKDKESVWSVNTEEEYHEKK